MPQGLHGLYRPLRLELHLDPYHERLGACREVLLMHAILPTVMFELAKGEPAQIEAVITAGTRTISLTASRRASASNGQNRQLAAGQASGRHGPGARSRGCSIVWAGSSPGRVASTSTLLWKSHASCSIGNEKVSRSAPRRGGYFYRENMSFGGDFIRAAGLWLGTDLNHCACTQIPFC